MARYGAKGTLLKIGDGAGTEVFTTIAQLTNINGLSLSQDTLETTDHDLTWKTFVPAHKDGGDVSIEGHFDPAAATQGYTSGLLSKFATATAPTNFKIVFTDTAATTWSFAALVTSFAPAAPHDGKLTFTATLKVSGQPTLA